MSMNEDTTRELPDATPFERRVLAEFAALRQENAALRHEVGDMNARLTVLEEKVDARMRETRPIWEGIQARLAAIEEAINDIRAHLKLIVKDLFQTRVRVEELEDQRRPPAA